MKSKRNVLRELTRGELADWVSYYDLEVPDRRVRDQLVEALAHSKKARLAEILIELSRDRLKEVCRGLGLSDRGRAKATLVDRLVGTKGAKSVSGKASDQASLALGELEDEGSSKPTAKDSKLTATLVDRGSTGVPAGPAGTKMALRRFSLLAASGFRGRDGSVEFARALIGCFGWMAESENLARAGLPEEVSFAHSISTLDGGKRGKRTVAACWQTRRVLVEVVEQDFLLDMAWRSLLGACLQMETEPQYVVLTNQRDVRLYDLARDRTAPRLTISVDELPKYSEAFPFFATDWSPGAVPKIINVEKVSQEVADLVGKVYRALAQKNPDQQDDAIRFTLQCIVAMFAEDIGLLPKEYFTTLLYRAAEEGDAMERIGALFQAMSTTRDSRRGGAEADIPYFNGGLFTDPVSLDLGATPLRALTKAAEANWTFVDPHIFGSVFEGIMGDAERHASGAHYTAREDIMSVVGPTIVGPWRERINAASTLKDFRTILTDLAAYRVLDPACGSGNFLYVAFREIYKIETEVLCRIAEFASMQSGKNQLSWASVIRTTNFFGIDINPFAVELAKTTLNIAKKIAFEERKATVQELYAQGFLDVDPSLPLDNLDKNVVCADALFAEWPAADAIVGNPPFLQGTRVRDEWGDEYLAKLSKRFVKVRGDISALWFNLAHKHLRPSGRAGLIGTSAIRFGIARELSLDVIASHGGTITEAISSKAWPGEAMVNVCVVNWIRGDHKPPFRLHVDGRLHHVSRISPHLQLHGDLSSACDLGYSPTTASEGLKLGSPGFQIDGAELQGIVSEEAVRPLATGSDLLAGRPPRYTVWLADYDSLELAADRHNGSVAYLSRRVRPEVEQRAADPQRPKHYVRWLERWWQPLDARKKFRAAASELSRWIACASPQSRPIFMFLSTKFVPTNTLRIFAYEDDYSFGIIQSSIHWEWVKAKGGRLKSDFRYTTAVWKTFPWPQASTFENVIDVAKAARHLRATRDRLMTENGWSLRALYQAAEVEGPHPLKDAQADLDTAVEAAYGKPADQEATEFLLELNLALAEDEEAGETIQGPGLPHIDGKALDQKDPRWYSTDCIEPPPLPTSDGADSGEGES